MSQDLTSNAEKHTSIKRALTTTISNYWKRSLISKMTFAKRPGHFVTYILIAVNALVFGAMLFYSREHLEAFMTGQVSDFFDPEQIRQWGGGNGPDILSGQLWRLVTSAFLHTGPSHLLINMLFLWRLGREVEYLLGWGDTLIIYLLASGEASLLSVNWHPTAMSTGASGAIMGLTGTLVALLCLIRMDLPAEKARSILLWAFFAMVLGLVSGLLSEHVDNAGHIGGLVSGLVIGVFFAWTFRSMPPKRVVQQRWILGSASAVLGVSLIALTQTRHDIVEFHLGELAVRHKDASAVEHFQRYVLLNPNDANGHVGLGTAFYSQRNYEQAALEYERAIAITPSKFVTKRHLAVLYTYFLNRKTLFNYLETLSLTYLPPAKTTAILFTPY